MAQGSFTMNWKGHSLQRQLQIGIREAIDETLGKAVQEAKPNTPVLTGRLQRSIGRRPARIKGTAKVEGEWGSFSVPYASFVETGQRTDPRYGTVRRRRGAANMLRNAGRKVYPQLAQAIKRRFKTKGIQ